MKPNLKIIKNELKNEKRVLPEQKPMALKPPVFEVDLIDFYNPNLKWLNSIKRWL